MSSVASISVHSQLYDPLQIRTTLRLSQLYEPAFNVVLVLGCVPSLPLGMCTPSLVVIFLSPSTQHSLGILLECE
jgi:hypothetical protein